MPSMRRTLVVARSQILSHKRLFYKSSLFGVLSFWISLSAVILVECGLFRRLASPVVLLVMVSSCFAIVMPGILMGRHRFQIGSTFRAYLAGFGFGVGFVLTVLILLAYVVLTETHSTPRMKETSTGISIVIAVSPFVFGFVACLIWLILRHRPSRVLVQDGTLCPGCAYSLVGNTSGRCPECGRTYTSDELSGGATTSPLPQAPPARRKDHDVRIERGVVIRAIFFSLGLLATSAVLSKALSINLVLLMILLTSLWAAVDSALIRARKFETGLSPSPLVLFAALGLFWIVGFPWYLVVRHMITHGTAKLKPLQ